MIDLDYRLLVDARNWAELKPVLMEKMTSKSQLIGLDIETDDRDRHDGLNALMKITEDGFNRGKKLVFDINRTNLDGLSLYFDGEKVGYYLNIFHADVENRIPWEEVEEVLSAKHKDSWWVIHNATFEKVMLQVTKGFDIGTNVICSLQFCVTAYNDDTYPLEKFIDGALPGIDSLFLAVSREFANYEPGQPLTFEQDELLYKVIAKESDAAHSYNGYVKSIRYGFGLKEAMKSWFGYEQVTYEKVLNGRPHMGCLTGAETAAYGVDDAWACVQLFHAVKDWVLKRNPAVIKTFFEQEMPMLEYYASVQTQGLKLNVEAVKKARETERKNYAQTLREMKAAIKMLLPFDCAPHEKLDKYDKWYAKNWEGYRAKVSHWANIPDSSDDVKQILQVRGAPGLALAAELGLPEPQGMSINHYMPMRTILYDLCRFSYQQADGKTLSDAEARDKMLARFVKAYDKENPGRVVVDKESKKLGEYLTDENHDPIYLAKLKVITSYKKLAGIEQRMKLYITPYLYLVDPDTGCVYPSLSSRLNTRRMACSNPNGQQLAKYGGSSYVRSFFIPDNPDEVLVSCDWSAVELVLIGEESQDPAFLDAYSSIPHKDLHTKAAAGVLGIDEEEFGNLPNKKELRKDIGKAANFGFWYSGGLGTVAAEQGWSSEEHWEKVDGYKNTFPVAVAWRESVIQSVRDNGFVELPDHHRRYRFEATQQWANIMRRKAQCYNDPAVEKFIDLCIKRIQTRAGNQAVNAYIQGGCATLAKRSIPVVMRKLREARIRARFWLAIHDELVLSVHKDDAWKAIPLVKAGMCEHPDLIKYTKLYSSASIGRNFEPFHAEKQPIGQIELDELPKEVDWLPKELWGKQADTEEKFQLVMHHLFA